MSAEQYARVLPWVRAQRDQIPVRVTLSVLLTDADQEDLQYYSSTFPKTDAELDKVLATVREETEGQDYTKAVFRALGKKGEILGFRPIKLNEGKALVRKTPDDALAVAIQAQSKLIGQVVTGATLANGAIIDSMVKVLGQVQGALEKANDTVGKLQDKAIENFELQQELLDRKSEREIVVKRADMKTNKTGQLAGMVIDMLEMVGKHLVASKLLPAGGLNGKANGKAAESLGTSADDLSELKDWAKSLTDQDIADIVGNVIRGGAEKMGEILGFIPDEPRKRLLVAVMTIVDRFQKRQAASGIGVEVKA